MRISALCLGSMICLAAFHVCVADDESVDPLVEMVLGLLNDADKDMRALGLEQIRTEAKGEAATKLFAAQIPKLPVDGQVGLIRALADRGDKAARPAMLQLLGPETDEAVRAAAIEALGYLGDPADRSLLTDRLSKGSAAEQAAAQASLIRLAGESVSADIVTSMQSMPSGLQVRLIGILAERHALETVPDLLKMATGSDAGVRAAAMATLGRLAGPEHIPAMLQGVLTAERGREREAAERCIVAVCSRIEDPEQRAAPVMSAMAKLPDQTKTVLLSTLGRIGGSQARKVIERAYSDTDRGVHAAGLGAMCNWPNGSIAPRLAEVAKLDAHPDHRKKALRALLRVAVLPDGRPDIQKFEWLQNALPLCTEAAEKKYLLERARNVRILQTLRFLVPYLDQPEFAQVACVSIVELAHHRELRDANKPEFHAALDRVMEISEDEILKLRAQRYKQGQTWTGQ